MTENLNNQEGFNRENNPLTIEELNGLQKGELIEYKDTRSGMPEIWVVKDKENENLKLGHPVLDPVRIRKVLETFYKMDVDLENYDFAKDTYELVAKFLNRGGENDRPEDQSLSLFDIEDATLEDLVGKNTVTPVDPEQQVRRAEDWWNTLGKDNIEVLAERIEDSTDPMYEETEEQRRKEFTNELVTQHLNRTREVFGLSTERGDINSETKESEEKPEPVFKSQDTKKEVESNINTLDSIDISEKLGVRDALNEERLRSIADASPEKASVWNKFANSIKSNAKDFIDKIKTVEGLDSDSITEDYYQKIERQRNERLNKESVKPNLNIGESFDISKDIRADKNERLAAKIDIEATKMKYKELVESMDAEELASRIHKLNSVYEKHYGSAEEFKKIHTKLGALGSLGEWAHSLIPKHLRIIDSAYNNDFYKALENDSYLDDLDKRLSIREALYQEQVGYIGTNEVQFNELMENKKEIMDQVSQKDIEKLPKDWPGRIASVFTGQEPADVLAKIMNYKRNLDTYFSGAGSNLVKMPSEQELLALEMGLAELYTDTRQKFNVVYPNIKEQMTELKLPEEKLKARLEELKEKAKEEIQKRVEDGDPTYFPGIEYYEQLGKLKEIESDIKSALHVYIELIKDKLPDHLASARTTRDLLIGKFNRARLHYMSGNRFEDWPNARFILNELYRDGINANLMAPDEQEVLNGISLQISESYGEIFSMKKIAKKPVNVEPNTEKIESDILDKAQELEETDEEVQILKTEVEESKIKAEELISRVNLNPYYHVLSQFEEGQNDYGIFKKEINKIEKDSDEAA